MKRNRERTTSLIRLSNNVNTSAALAAAAGLFSTTASAQPTLLYQWNFDGATPAQPNTTAGGGTIGITNSANGSVGFNSTGGVGGGGMLDLSHNQQWGTLDPAGYASSAAPGNALT